MDYTVHGVAKSRTCLSDFAVLIRIVVRIPGCHAGDQGLESPTVRQHALVLALADIHDFPGGLDGKTSVCNAGDPGSIPGLGQSLGEGKGNPLQYSGLENSMDCVVHGVTKSRTQLSDFH